MKKIVLTGGGTAGHVMPNLALLPELNRQGYQLFYIGSHNGIEAELAAKVGISYYSIATGKLRRYLSLKNLTDPFRVIKGLWEAIRIIKELKPDVVFSKGGFVSVPVTIGAWINRVPVILHESDLTPGLANRLALPFASLVCATFPDTMKHLPSTKSVLTGNPIRAELLQGSREAGLKLCGFSNDKPVLAVLGGSLGSVVINKTVRSVLPELLKNFQIVHICGKGNIDNSLDVDGYQQFEFVNEELAHLLAAADVCLSRAGANFIFELLALRKPSLLIPLSKNASRGDQILNAQSFAKQGFSMLLPEEELTAEKLLEQIAELYNNRQQFIKAMADSELQNATKTIVDLINKFCNK
ncbi:MAG TPA: undecaprenyldiphospho-muramoylpentapeptide beta-N-acetylglucosaminyltransferase [Bacillota bacterium]|nr:undecaprenyldiphospho-muramoylpentapeptide beta-N-acetylglucosaminyltransferase [Bacillota bacterium]HPO96412.1 undecaprenyldiphospho-muramoylpentapeptide beta-N-acetylglucosaminyltransferase [Bacillota bacterium]